MTGTGRAIGVGAFIMLAVLGTAWALEHRHPISPTGDGAAGGGGVPGTVAPQPSGAGRATDSQPEYDRSDLLLSQG